MITDASDQGGMEPPPSIFYPEAHKNQSGEKWAREGIELWHEGHFADAEIVFREGLLACRFDHELWTITGALYGQMGDHNSALNSHREALVCLKKTGDLFKPKSAISWHGLGATFGNMGERALCLKYELRAMEADPTYAPARDGLAMAYQKCFQMKDAIRTYQDLLLEHPSNEGAISHLCLASIYMPETTPESLYVTHRYYGEIAERLTENKIVRDKTPDRKLRVGFFSSDYKAHSVAYFMEPLIRDLDRDRFEVFLYYFGERHDEYTARFKTYGKWHEYRAHMSCIPKILGDELDIAFDLGGHTGHQLTLFASRIAPVQIVYMGYPSTTGLTRMDYRFTDSLADPEGEADKWHTEKLVRMNPNSWCYRPPDLATEPKEPPCINNGYITFGSFNNFSKMSDGWLLLWRRILDSVPDSRLVLKAFGMADGDINPMVVYRLKQLGFPMERVKLHGAVTKHNVHFDMYGEMDIALDPHPFNGAATTCEALYMGVPVITMAGDRHAARVGVALLDAIGRREWIAKDEDDYVRIAVLLASRPTNLERMRASQRRSFQGSILMDYPGQAKRFGNCIRQCWQEYCAK